MRVVRSKEKSFAGSFDFVLALICEHWAEFGPFEVTKTTSLHWTIRCSSKPSTEMHALVCSVQPLDFLIEWDWPKPEGVVK